MTCEIVVLQWEILRHTSRKKCSRNRTVRKPHYRSTLTTRNVNVFTYCLKRVGKMCMREKQGR